MRMNASALGFCAVITLFSLFFLVILQSVSHLRDLYHHYCFLFLPSLRCGGRIFRFKAGALTEGEVMCVSDCRVLISEVELHRIPAAHSSNSKEIKTLHRSV